MAKYKLSEWHLLSKIDVPYQVLAFYGEHKP